MDRQTDRQVMVVAICPGVRQTLQVISF